MLGTPKLYPAGAATEWLRASAASTSRVVTGRSPSNAQTFSQRSA